MQEIEALQLIVRANGQQQPAAVTDANAAHAKGVLDRERRKILTNGYHFNTDRITIEVDANDRVPLSRDYLKVCFNTYQNLSWRDDGPSRFVWDVDANDWHHDRLENVDVVYLLDFDRLPEPFARWIADKAALENWYDSNVGADNSRLVRNLRESNALAINSLPPMSLNVHGATGYRAIQAIGNSGSSAVRSNGRWIYPG